MGLRIVDDDSDIDLDIPADSISREAISIQLQRVCQGGGVQFFKKLLDSLMSSLDNDLRPPTPSQISYATAISKTLGIPLPHEALRLRGSVCDYLDLHIPEFQKQMERRREAKARSQTFRAKRKPKTTKEKA